MPGAGAALCCPSQICPVWASPERAGLLVQGFARSLRASRAVAGVLESRGLAAFVLLDVKPFPGWADQLV